LNLYYARKKEENDDYKEINPDEKKIKGER
jgi:hypothetical protein